jgi:hypothetical protein
VLKYILTPWIYNKSGDSLSPSTGLPRLNYLLYGWGNVIARFVFGGVLVESIWAGHARNFTDIIIASFHFPLFMISLAFSVNIVVFLKEMTYLINQVLKVHMDIGKTAMKSLFLRYGGFFALLVAYEMCLGRYFNIPPNALDGNEKFIALSATICTIIGIVAVPATVLFMYSFSDLYYHIIRPTLEENFIVGALAGFGLAGDLTNINFCGCAIFCHFRSTVNFLKLMTLRPGSTCSNERLADYIRIYKLFPAYKSAHCGFRPVLAAHRSRLLWVHGHLVPLQLVVLGRHQRGPCSAVLLLHIHRHLL